MLKVEPSTERPESVLLKFLKARQAQTSVPLDVVPVTWVGGGRPKECMTNAARLVAQDPDRFRVVSGWLVHRFDRTREHQLFELHWWAFDAVENLHLDPTPDIGRGCVYVEDMDICYFYLVHEECMAHWLPFNNLVFKIDKFVLARWENGRTISKIARDLSVQTIFENFLGN